MKKKILIILACISFCFFCLQQNTLASCSVPTIALATSTPTIDGTIDAVWANAPAQSIAITTIPPAITSPAGQWRGMYDATNFYFLIEVTDPQPMVNGSWNGDAVELCLQGGGSISNRISLYQQCCCSR